jgi:hypothetical protein
MFMSAQNARGPEEHEKMRHWSGALPAKEQRKAIHEPAR